MERHEFINQTKQVFEYLQKLYLETSYFIKEVEGILANETEQFAIGRSGGYAVTSNRSSGLEPTNVELWLLRKMAVFFIPKEQTHLKGGQTITPVEPHIKVLYLRVVLDGKGISEPLVFFGTLHNFVKKDKTFPEKLEQLMGHIEYHESQVFRNPQDISYEDGYISFQGELHSQNLFDLNSSEKINEKLIQPGLRLFRSIS